MLQKTVYYMLTSRIPWWHPNPVSISAIFRFSKMLAKIHQLLTITLSISENFKNMITSENTKINFTAL